MKIVSKKKKNKFLKILPVSLQQVSLMYINSKIKYYINVFSLNPEYETISYNNTTTKYNKKKKLIIINVINTKLNYPRIVSQLHSRVTNKINIFLFPDIIAIQNFENKNVYNCYILHRPY